jgi:hypothetical protein
LALLRDTGEVVEMSDLAARVVGLCRGFRTLEQHALAVGETGVCGSPELVAQSLEACVRAGLLASGPISAGQVRRAPEANAPRLAAVVVLTADRPGMLRRCLAALSKHCAGREPCVRVVVVDGSRREGRAAANRALVAELSKTCTWSLEYLGRAEAKCIRQRLRREGLPATALDVGLTPGEIGAGRNLGIAATSGEDVVMVDDDVLCTVWADAGREETLQLVGHEDVRKWKFLSSRKEAMALARPECVNLLDEHGRLLSAPLRSCVSKWTAPIDATLACRHVACGLEGKRAAVIRVTMAGLAGDSGMYCPSYLMFQPWSAARACGGDPLLAEAALRSREVHRIAAMPLVTHYPSCMAYCTGFANSALLPPFMPMGRNEDGVFGSMLATCDEGALFAHLPFGVIHDSARDSRYGRDELRAAREVRISEFILWAIRASVAGTVLNSPIERMQRIGRGFTDLASLRLADFRDLVRDVILVVRGSELERVDRQLASDNVFARCWAAPYANYRRAFMESVKDASFFIPVEFKGRGDDSKCYAAAQEFVGLFGELIGAWPSVWTACRERRLGAEKAAEMAVR